MNSLASIVLLLGIFICGVSVFGILYPKALIRMIDRFWKYQFSFYLAVALRLIFGGILILAAPQSRYPAIFQMLGIITLLAAVGIFFLGRSRISSIIAWWKTLAPEITRILLCLELLLGVFLIYAVS